MRLRTLGGPKLDERPYPRRKALLLISYLAVEGPRDRRYLADLFWPDAADRRNSLAQLLSQLRRELPGAVELSGSELSVTLESDLGDLFDAIGQGAVERTLELYIAPFLSALPAMRLGVELEEWVERTREFVAGSVRTLLLDRALAQAAAGALADGERWASAAISVAGAAPLEAHEIERLYPILLLANSTESGRLRAEGEAFGLPLASTIEEARDALTQVAHPAPSPVRLPVRGGAFVGREREMAEIAALLARRDARLISVVGPGGAGKTRLTLHLLRRWTASGEGPVVAAVDLTLVDDPAALLGRVAEAFGLTPGDRATSLQQLERYLREREALLLVDNFEHLPDAAVDLQRLLSACPGLTCLVTTRTRLHVEGEWVFDLDGLPYPATAAVGRDVGARYSAVRLFLDRARRVRRDFVLDDVNWPAVHTICQLVDGLPLALEMAASWVRLLDPSEVAAEIRSGLDILTSEARDLPERQRSVRATLDHSWQLLAPQTRDGFVRLSVFIGGFDREAAGRVASADITLLSRLVDASLLRPLPDGRFNRHGLVAQYAAEKFAALPDEARTLRERHARYYAAWVEAARDRLSGGDQALWLSRVEREHDNLRAALRWAVEERDTACALRLVVGMGPFWRRRGHFVEGRGWLDQVRALPGLEAWPLLRAGAHIVAGDMVRRLDSYASAEKHYRLGLAAFREVGDLRGEASALMTLGIVAAEQGEMATARSYFEEGLSLERRLGRRRGVAAALGNLATIAEMTGDYDTSWSMNEESLAIKRDLGDESGVAASLGNLGLIATYRGAYAEAERRFEACLAIERSLGDRSNVVLTLNYLGALQQRRGDDAAAEQRHREAHSLAEEIGDKGALAETLDHLGRIATRRGELHEAGALHAHGLAIGRALGSRAGIATALAGLGRLDLYSSELALARDRLLESLELRRALGERAGVASALQLLGWITAERGALDAASALEEEALALRVELGDRHQIADSLVSVGRLELRLGRREAARHRLLEGAILWRDLGGHGQEAALFHLAGVEAAFGRLGLAARLWGAAEALRERNGIVLPPIEERGVRKSVVEVHRRLGEQPFAAAWRQGRSADPDRLLEEAVGVGGAGGA
jgi:predicted ATPase